VRRLYYDVACLVEDTIGWVVSAVEWLHGLRGESEDRWRAEYARRWPGKG
jgi:hypothetical protein